MPDTPLTAAEVAHLNAHYVSAQFQARPMNVTDVLEEERYIFYSAVKRDWPQIIATIDTLTTRAEQAEARVTELTAALTEQGLLQKRADGSMVWHVYDCPASFDFAQCNYRCRVAREAFALAGTEPYVSPGTRRDTEVYE